MGWVYIQLILRQPLAKLSTKSCLLGHFPRDVRPTAAKMPLSGKRLELIQTCLIALPSFILFGYNQSGIGGLLSINSWVETFPEIDTIHTTGAQKATNSTIQVRSASYRYSGQPRNANILHTGNDRSYMHSWCTFWSSRLCINRRHPRTTKDGSACCSVDIDRRSAGVQQLWTRTVHSWPIYYWARRRCSQHNSTCLAIGMFEGQESRPARGH